VTTTRSARERSVPPPTSSRQARCRPLKRLRRRGDTQQADRFDAWLAGLKEGCGERLVPISTAIAERWGRLNAIRPLPPIDGLMAAAAIEHDLILVTRDTEPLAGTGPRMLDPWQS
jgi:PIN domain nuclease of toxin-antitoxin system